MKEELYTIINRKWIWDKKDFPELGLPLYVTYQRHVDRSLHRSVVQDLSISYALSDGNKKGFMFSKNDSIRKGEEDILGDVHKGILNQRDLDISIYDFLQTNLPRSARELLIKPSD